MRPNHYGKVSHNMPYSCANILHTAVIFLPNHQYKSNIVCHIQYIQFLLYCERYISFVYDTIQASVLK